MRCVWELLCQQRVMNSMHSYKENATLFSVFLIPESLGELKIFPEPSNYNTNL